MPSKPGEGKCKVCGKALVRQSRKFVSNVFCTTRCKARHWKTVYGSAGLRARDRVVDGMVEEYCRSAKQQAAAPPRFFEPPETHHG